MQPTEFKPLYQQVSAKLTARIASGHWAPGEKIPSEFALADELKVSQGTVRKALGAMTADNIVIRHQGRGTFVPEQTVDRTLSRFFRIRLSDGSVAAPVFVTQRLSQVPATADHVSQFDCANPGDPWLIERIRNIASDIPILERILVRSDLIPDLGKARPQPISLFEHYQKSCSITIARVEDRLHADIARPFHLRRINLTAGTPLMVVDRLSFDLRDRIVEARTTYFPTDRMTYDISLR